MTTRLLIVGSVLCLSACTPQYDGTFVGNPSMDASYLGNDTQNARAGLLSASEVSLTGCEGDPDLQLGSAVFAFEGGESTEAIQLPQGDYCGVLFVVDELTVSFDEGGAALTRVTGSAFNLSVSVPFTAAAGGHLHLRLGDGDWLATLAEHAVPGEPNLVDDSDLLRSAFYTGLRFGSTIEDVQPGSESTTESDLAGRLDLEGYPQSPSGYPTEQPGCEGGVQYHMGIPIPPAAMAAMGLGTEVGWCEGEVRFDDDLVDSTAVQVDYSDGSTYPITYNGWGQGCPGLHCNAVVSAAGDALPRACTVLAFCDAAGLATVAGFSW